MLLYKDGRFYAGRSSFALVDGCKVNDDSLAFYRNGINLYTADEAYMVDVNIFRMVVTAPHDSKIEIIRRTPEIVGLLNSFQP